MARDNIPPPLDGWTQEELLITATAVLAQLELSNVTAALFEVFGPDDLDEIAASISGE